MTTKTTSMSVLSPLEWTCDIQSSIRMEDPPQTPPAGEKPPADSPPAGAPPPPAAGASPPAEPPAAQTEPPPPAPAGGTEPPVDWRDRRIAKLTAQLRELQTKNATPPADVKPPAASETQAQFDARVQAEAQRLRAADAFNEACEATATAGRQQFGEAEFNGRVAQLSRLYDRNDQQSIATYNDFLAAILETGKGAEIVHRLGADLNEAARLMSLSPVKRAAELAKLAAAPVQAASAAPKPITPIRGGAGATHEEIDPRDPDKSDKLSTAEWMRRREAQMAQQDRRRGAA